VAEGVEGNEVQFKLGFGGVLPVLFRFGFGRPQAIMQAANSSFFGSGHLFQKAIGAITAGEQSAYAVERLR
jgi:hypothetical protein